MIKVEEAVDDAEDPKSAIIELIRLAVGEAEALREELGQLKIGALRKRAKAAGADMDTVEQAIDEEDNPKTAVIELIGKAMVSGGGLPEGEPSRRRRLGGTGAGLIAPGHDEDWQQRLAAEIGNTNFVTGTGAGAEFCWTTEDHL